MWPTDLSTTIQNWTLWLEHSRQVSSHTHEAYHQDLKKFLTFLTQHFNESPTLETLQGLSLQDLRGWLASLNQKNYDTLTIRRSVAGVRNFYRYLFKEIGLDNTAIKLLRLPKRKLSLPKPLSENDVTSLLSETSILDRDPWVMARDKALFMLIYATGLRISEALSLKPKDLGAVLIITGKGNKQRRVPLIPQVLHTIQDYVKSCPFSLDGTDLLFRGVSGKPLNPGVAQRQLRTYRNLLGLPESTTPHALRHTFATHLMANSQDLRGIQELLGHANLSTTQIYTQVETQQLLKTYNAAHPRSGNK